MGFYQFKRELKIVAEIDDVWKFISVPANLKKITPEYMGFDITTDPVPDTIYEGLVISYKVKPLFGIGTTWVTEITHLKPNHYFVDEQRVGPYKMWHHEHFLREDKDGVVMTDIVSYKPPFGIIGSLANHLVIGKKLDEIFDYRRVALIKYFGQV